MYVESMRFESIGSQVNLGQLAWWQGGPQSSSRLSHWGREESLTGHVVLVQLLEGEGDVVQLRQGHPEVLQHGAFLPLQEEDRVEERQVPPCPRVSLQDAETQHQLWACQVWA